MGINRRKGGPQLVPVWYTYEDGCVLIPTELRVAKVANISRDPEVSFCVDDKSTPHKGVVMYCTAEVIRDGIADKRREIMSKYVGDEEGAESGIRTQALGHGLNSTNSHTAPTPTTTQPPTKAGRTSRTTGNRGFYSPILSLTSKRSSPRPGTTKPMAILCGSRGPGERPSLLS